MMKQDTTDRRDAPEDAVHRLLASNEASVRYGARVDVLGEDPCSLETMRLRGQVRSSARVQTLLSEREADGTIPVRPYSKWRGAHWVLAALADLGYPDCDEDLAPLREQVLGWLLSDSHARTVTRIEGRTRTCASQEGNALHALLVLGLADDRCEELVRRLLEWQWPDGGWNCDKRPEAHNSSFMETLIPLRALMRYSRLTGDGRAYLAAREAAEVFLKRRLYLRRRDGAVISDDFLKLHYPCYWHYDILFALKVMAEAGLIGDPRCEDALDVLEGKRLPGGGFPAEGRYYTTREAARSGRSLVDWGGVNRRKMNEFVTVGALSVLRKAGRLPTRTGTEGYATSTQA
jgi:hypothetical protein